MATTDISGLVSSVLKRNQRALARAATLLEQMGPTAQDLISQLFPFSGRAKLVGVTGPGGAGKSSLINSCTHHLRSLGKSVGVVAVDPSSSISDGAILGDRIRMLEHSSDSGVFIRSSASRGITGGLAASTMNLAILLDAAGFDFIFIETVGAGQDEIDIASLADWTVLVLAPGFGDGIQAIKAGIMEIASIFAINKADQPGAGALADEIRFAQGLSTFDRKAPICDVVAKDKIGVVQLVKTLESLANFAPDSKTREERWKRMLVSMVKEKLVHYLDLAALMHHASLVSQRLESPYDAAEQILAALHPGDNR